MVDVVSKDEEARSKLEYTKEQLSKLLSPQDNENLEKIATAFQEVMKKHGVSGALVLQESFLSNSVPEPRKEGFYIVLVLASLDGSRNVPPPTRLQEATEIFESEYKGIIRELGEQAGLTHESSEEPGLDEYGTLGYYGEEKYSGTQDQSSVTFASPGSKGDARIVMEHRRTPFVILAQTSPKIS